MFAFNVNVHLLYMWVVVINLLVVLLLISLSLVSANKERTLSDKPKLEYCPFFANRAPNIQLGLKNCTWFRENSCCRQQEIDAIFSRVKPLRGASPACQRYTNYLMCYVCAPNQNTFYRVESLTVCEEFCDAWYEACQNAVLKGSVIKELYSNGSEYCASRRFKVQPAETSSCYYFDARRDKSEASRSMVWRMLLSGVLIFPCIQRFRDFV
ncbi:unnamed protein product [Candidula unifasciata]|uniref:Folate receptor-like domain-containing protein n=1 Tax=Candidula unifasciata TaxID=100452 RepID=A0A8S3ZEL9_9EUPU|nr:unnamed protein product [Candidula unifasciata]